MKRTPEIDDGTITCLTPCMMRPIAVTPSDGPIFRGARVLIVGAVPRMSGCAIVHARGADDRWYIEDSKWTSGWVNADDIAPLYGPLRYLGHYNGASPSPMRFAHLHVETA